MYRVIEAGKIIFFVQLAAALVLGATLGLCVMAAAEELF
jgi:hypothetical protein